MLSPEILAQVKVTAAALWQEEQAGRALQKVTSSTPESEADQRNDAYFLACQKSHAEEQRLLAMVYAAAHQEVPSS
jgi:16S rRNA G1207 methylase RsmC